ncbi:sulfotransferase family 2 domain-containing protein [Sphingomonas sp. UYEF23]|uniref:sulfotransferase family 2 domain-containing protein n=1 Tax=Sphingomonas sp. UYEF23 TaxID=1756408 RepID=UPI003396F034
MNYTIAAFVRNPYDRAYSGFMQLQRDYADQHNVAVDPNWIENLIRTQIAENMHRIIASGYDFDNWIYSLPDYEVFEAGRNTNMVLHPCHYWTHVDSVQIVGFVGKVEQFERDFQRFCRHVDIEPPAIQLANVSKIENNEAVEGSKYAGKMSRRSLDRINYLFAADFEIFGYKML